MIAAARALHRRDPECPAGGQDIAEVSNLETAVRVWVELEPHHKADAVLTIEHPILLDGVATSSFTGLTIAALAEHLPA